MRLVIIVPFLNEAELLPVLLRSIERQTRRPDSLYLVDDGSTDGSTALAEAFAREHDFTTVVKLEKRPLERDRLATASELRAFHRALAELDGEYDVICKMDADLELVPEHLETVLDAMAGDPELGITGTFLAARHADGRTVREVHPEYHVPGPNKFYRRACLDQIEPLPEILGWDAFDEIRARGNGWRTQAIACRSGDSVHLRPTGTHDGILRAYRRWGTCAWGWGSHPLYVLASAAFRVRNRPLVLGGAAYVWGYLVSGARRAPRVDPWTRAQARREELSRLRSFLPGSDPAKRGGIA